MNEAAQAAKLIKQYIKSLGINASVKSDTYSMGSSVNAYLVDQPPEIKEKIEQYANQYQYGHFDGMIDLYEYSNVNDDIPQAKFVSVTNKPSDQLKDEIVAYIKQAAPNLFGDLPDNYKEANNIYIKDLNKYFDQVLWMIFSHDYLDLGFWKFKQQQKAA